MFITEIVNFFRHNKNDKCKNEFEQTEIDLKHGVEEIQECVKSIEEAIAKVEQCVCPYKHICDEEKSVLYQCYSENPRESLNCENAVKSFNKCVKEAIAEFVNNN